MQFKPVFVKGQLYLDSRRGHLRIFKYRQVWSQKGIGFVWGGQEICVWIELLDRKNRNKLGKKI